MFNAPPVVSIVDPAPAVTVPVTARPAVPVPPTSFSESAPVVVSVPRLSMAILVAVRTPAEPVSVAALIRPVNAVCDTVPDNGKAFVPRTTPPLVAVTTFTVALAAATI